MIESEIPPSHKLNACTLSLSPCREPSQGRKASVCRKRRVRIIDAESGRKGGYVNKRNHSFIMESKLSDVRGRVDYISSPERQEHLYAVYSDVQDHYWELLAEQNQKDFLKSGTKGTCIEGRELIIMLPPSLMGYDHDLLLKYITTVFTEKYNVGCCAALHHNKTKTNFHIHLIFSERKMRQEAEHKIAGRNLFFNESGKRMRTKKEILDENGKIRKGCRVVNKGEIYEINFFYPKEEIFKSNQFLRDIKQIMTDAINGLVKDENEKLYVFQKGGPYLATKKIGKNNPRADEIRTDNYLRQKWNENVDRAFLVGATEEEISLHKKEQIDKPVAESIKMQGENPQAFTGILQKAIGMLRGFAEYLRAMELAAIDESGRSLIGREIKIDVTPEDLPEKQKISRPSSIKQETEVMRVKQILNDLKKQEKKVYAIEKNVIRLEKELREVQKKWFHGKEKKELQNRVDGKRNQLENAQYMMNLILSQNGYRNVLEVVNDLKQAEKELQKVQEEQREWDEQKSGSKKLYLSIPVAKQKEESRERKISDEKALPEQPKKRKRRDMEL